MKSLATLPLERTYSINLVGIDRLAGPSIHLSLELGRQVVWQDALLLEVDLHALEALFIRSLDIIDLDPFWQIPHELGSVKLVVGSIRLEDLCLLFNRKVGVFKLWVNVLFEEVEHFIVRDDARVGKVVDSRKSLLGHCERSRQHLVENRHGVWNVDDLLVLCNLGHKVTVRKVIRDRHSNSKNQAVGVAFEHGLHVSFGLTVKGTRKVGSVLLCEADPRAHRMLLVVLEDTAGRIHGAMNVLHKAKISHVQSTNHVAAYGLGLVILAPINVGPTSDTSRHEYVRGLDFVQLCFDICTILDADLRVVDFDACVNASQSCM